MRKNILIIIVLVVLIAVFGFVKNWEWGYGQQPVKQIQNINQASSSNQPGSNQPVPSQPAQGTVQPIASASYLCGSGLTIQAKFYPSDVKLLLSDGEAMELPHAVSADGARYATADESFVFWSKGNGAMIMKNNKVVEPNCLGVAADSGGLPQVYASSSLGISLRYPAGYKVDNSHQYQALGPGREINGVSFTIPETMATGTNLAQDTYLSVEKLPTAKDCRADLFLDLASAASGTATTTDNGVTYSVAGLADAGAGNRYEETVYAIPGTSPCLAIRYYIHYGALENYPVGLVKAFDKDALVKQFDAMRRTLMIQ
jgi:membrane-bound inhibitor of C-type lysozyme